MGRTFIVMVIMSVDFFQRFTYQGSDPNADVSGKTVHQTETCNNFEFVNVQLNSFRNGKTNQLEIQLEEDTNKLPLQRQR